MFKYGPGAIRRLWAILSEMNKNTEPGKTLFYLRDGVGIFEACFKSKCSRRAT